MNICNRLVFLASKLDSRMVGVNEIALALEWACDILWFRGQMCISKKRSVKKVLTTLH